MSRESTRIHNKIRMERGRTPFQKKKKDAPRARETPNASTTHPLTHFPISYFLESIARSIASNTQKNEKRNKYKKVDKKNAPKCGFEGSLLCI
jgi:hypothetical protein